MTTLSKLACLVLAFVFCLSMQAQTTPAQPPAQPAQPGQTPPAAQPGQAQPGAQPAPAGQPQQPGAQPAPAGQPQQKKEIKDPAEYNAYVGGVGQSDPGAKASAMESFLTQYPNSVVKEEALEALMAAYQQLNNAPKMSDAGNRLLQVNPSNIKALLVMALQKRAEAESGGPNSIAAAQQARQFGERGMQAIQNYLKPEGMSDADYQKLRSTALLVFNGAAGRGALQAKDYAGAQKFYAASVQADPNNLNDVFPLSVAYLEPKPPVMVGFWYAARAAGLAAGMVQRGQLPAQAQKQISDYGRIKYKNFHGGEDGWNELIAQAQSSPTAPTDFAVKPAPTPAEQVAAMVKTKPPRQMDFGEWQLVFTYGDQATVDQVWNAIKGVNLQFVAQVISATKTQLMLAATADAIQAGKSDVEVTMAAPIPATRMPKPGQQITIQAMPTSYDKQPYLMRMGEGKLAVAKSTGKKAAPATRRRRR